MAQGCKPDCIARPKALNTNTSTHWHKYPKRPNPNPNRHPPAHAHTQVDMDPDAFKGARKGKARSFAADPGLFPCDLSEGALAKVWGGVEGGGVDLVFLGLGDDGGKEGPAGGGSRRPRLPSPMSRSTSRES